MAKGVGLDAGEYEVKAVELEGSLRKPRMTKVSIEKVDQSVLSPADEVHAECEAESASHVLKDAKIACDNVSLGFPCREAVLRNITVPFTGVDAIRKVIKFETEGEIHSHSVDDMVVDFHVLEELDGETRVMVAAVPKLPLQTTLTALAGAGIEPEFVDLDTMALYRAAQFCGCFDNLGDPKEGSRGEQSDGDEAKDLPAVVETAKKIRLILDIGARSVRVLAVCEGQFVDMRALRIGVDSIHEDVAHSLGISTDSARDAVLSSLDSGDDVVIEGLEDDEDEDQLDRSDRDETEPAASAKLPASGGECVQHDDVLAARDDFLARFRCELLRFLSGLTGLSEVEAVFVTGGGSQLSGIDETLEEIFACPAQSLNVLGHVPHSFADDEVDLVGPRLAVAFGLALGSMGARPAFDFRQEDLVYTRKFDRIKFPLAVACMFAAFLPFIYGMVQHRKLQNLEKTYGMQAMEQGSTSKRGRKKVPEFSGFTGWAYNPNQPSTSVVRFMDDKAYIELGEELLAVDTFERLPMIRKKLMAHHRAKQQETGVYQDLRLPSGLNRLAYMATLIKGIEKELGAFLVTEVDLNLPYRELGRVLRFKVAFRGDDFRARFQVLEDAFRSDFKKPDSPFKAFRDRSGTVTPFVDAVIAGGTFNIEIDLR